MISTVTRREALGTIALSMLSNHMSAVAAPRGVAPSETSAEPMKNSRILVVYLSRSGNTRVIAGQLKRAYGADLFEIRTAAAWPEDYEAMVAWASRLHESGTAPRLAENVSNMEKYDVVFLGSPIWGTALPAPVRTFLSTHDPVLHLRMLRGRKRPGDHRTARTESKNPEGFLSQVRSGARHDEQRERLVEDR